VIDSVPTAMTIAIIAILTLPLQAVFAGLLTGGQHVNA